MFKNWCFEADKGTQPDFVLQANKNLCVSVLEKRSAVDPTTNLMNGYSHRITSIKMDIDVLNEELEFPVIPELDTICTEYCHIGIAQVSKLFPQNAEVL